jgi:hypothetical protein
MLKVGERVTLRDLKAKPELNGTQGTVCSFDSERQRYGVKGESGHLMFLKPENLLLVMDLKVHREVANDEPDTDCVICLQLLEQPVTLSCGH